MHVRSTQKLEAVIQHAGVHGYQLGLAFSNEDDLGLLKTMESTAIDFVQLMGIAEIGAQGNPFDARVLERIAFVKKHFPALPISIDGGVNLDTIDLLKKAGAERFVAGSAILNADDPKGAFDALCARS